MSLIEKIDKHTYRIDAYYGAPFHSCVYLIGDGGEYALIDAGTALSEKYILGALAALGISPEAVKYILPTHVHLDHAGGVGVLCRSMPKAQVYVHPRGKRHLIDPTKLKQASVVIYGEFMMKYAVGETQPVPAERCHELEDGMELIVGNLKIATQFTPGHAKHHCGFFEQQNGNYYSGDVMGNSYQMMDHGDRHLMFLCSAPTDYDGAAWHASLDKIASVSPKQIGLCHYGMIDNLAPAFADMHRLIDKSDEEAMKLINITEPAERRAAVEQLVWRLFWDEFNSHQQPMPLQHAEDWMKKDIHISTEGVDHWLKQQQSDL